MKFLIREMGWEAWRAELSHTLDEVHAEGGVASAFRSRGPAPRGGARVDASEDAPRSRRRQRGRRRPRCAGPASGRRVEPALARSAAELARWTRRQRPPAEAGGLRGRDGDRSARGPDERAAPVARRSRGLLLGRHAAHHARAEPAAALGARRRRCRISSASSPQPASGGPGGDDRGPSQLSGRRSLPARRHAVPRPGAAAPGARACPARALPKPPPT